MLVDSTQTQQELLRQIQEQWTDAEKKVDALLRLTPEKQSRRLQLSHIGLRTPVIVEVLLKRAHEQGFLDSDESYSLAKTAFTVATRISGYDDRVGCHQLTWDYQALASAQMANACRIGCWWGSAHENMERAFRLQLLGTGAPRVVAQLCSLRASLYKDSRWYEEALLDLRTARELYEGMGRERKQELAHVLVNIGTVHYQCERFDDAMKANEAAMDHIDERRQKTLLAIASCNRALFLTELGDPATALQSFALIPTFQELGVSTDSILCAYRDWEIGRAHLALQQFGEARAQFDRAIQCFEAKQDPFNKALVMLDLSRLYRAKGEHSADFYRCAREALALLKSQSLDTEAKETTQLLNDALAEEVLTAKAIVRAVRDLRAHRNHQRFRPPTLF
ncbi:MAG: hypothetical protein AAGD01_07885 [Acidobacteriota bacterium]